jgi:hypothetical protein
MSQMSTAHSDDEYGPLVISPKGMATILDCSLTKVYEIINGQEVESYLDGHSRKIVVASIRRYIAKRLAASGEGGEPAKLQDKIASATAASLAARQRRPRRLADQVQAQK